MSYTSYICYIKNNNFRAQKLKNSVERQTSIDKCRDNNIICITVDELPVPIYLSAKMYRISYYTDDGISSASIEVNSDYQRDILLPLFVKGLLFNNIKHLNGKNIKDEWKKINTGYYTIEHEEIKNNIMNDYDRYMKEEEKYIEDGGDINDPKFLGNYRYYKDIAARKIGHMNNFARFGNLTKEENAFRKSCNKKVVAKKQPPKKRTSDNDFMNKISRFTGIKF